MDGTALILTCGRLGKDGAKTAHGLIRGTERYEILGVVDEASAGRDAGTVLDGRRRGIPVFATLGEAVATLAAAGRHVQHAIVGLATPGGRITPDLHAAIAEALGAGLSVVNGLHDLVSEVPELVDLAMRAGGRIVDVRKPRRRDELHFWTGDISRVTCATIAVLGTDCAIGKRTTARMLVERARAAGRTAHMIFTGQTGWMQGGRYGFILDSTLNDFVSGELEHAIVSCFDREKPDLIVVEGQSALRNPSGPCGAEILLSGKMDGVVLQHHPRRRHFHDFEAWGDLPSLASEIDLVRMYGVPVVGLALNTDGLTPEDARTEQAAHAKAHGLAVSLPLFDEAAPLYQAIAKKFLV
jgi:uncharacterized NAD-dependent epimerase/dehydratase family protein